MTTNVIILVTNYHTRSGGIDRGNEIYLLFPSGS